MYRSRFIKRWEASLSAPKVDRTRRFFLTGAAASVIALASSLLVPMSAEAWMHGSAISTFYGNPNVTITAVDVSGGIACSRTGNTGSLPCPVHVSAKNITATGTTIPYEDLSFRWTFGDPNSTEVVYDPTVGAYTFPNIQVGPEAAYVYRSVGTYTITLQVIGPTGFALASTTLSFVVTAFTPSQSLYFSPTGNDTTGNGSQALPYLTITKLNTFLTSGPITNRAFYLERGGSWGSDGVGILFNNNTDISGIRFDAYGSGPDPIVSVNGSAAAVTITPGGGSSVHPKTDIVFSNVKLFTTTGSTSTASVTVAPNSNPLALLKDIYFLNCTIGSDANVSGAIALVANTTVAVTNFGVWKCTFSQPLIANLGNRSAFFGGADTYSFLVGCSISGAGSNIILDHHFYPDTRFNLLVAFNDFGVGPGRSFCVNTNFNSYSGSLEYSDYTNIRQNSMANVQFAHDASNANNDPQNSRFRNFVSELNWIHDLASTSGAIFFYCVESMTVRYNRSTNVAGLFSPNGALGSVLNAKLYGNSGYQTAGATAPYIGFVNAAYTLTSISNASPAVLTRSSPASRLYNIPEGAVGRLTTTGALPSPLNTTTDYYAVSRSADGLTMSLSLTRGGAAINTTTAGSGTHTFTCKWDAKQVDTNNIIMDARVTASLVSCVFADQSAATSLFDNNQYRAASSASPFVDGVSQKAFDPSGTAGTWQNAGFDLQGILLSGTPSGWTVPPTRWSDFGS